MKVMHVPITASDAANGKLYPSLTPQLLAACGARYSRSPEGLETLLENALKSYKEKGEEKAVESIFRMIDYGHQSIADMAPVAMFLDDLSIYMIYHLFELTPTAGGQETSTRYVRFTQDGVIDPAMIPGIDYEKRLYFDRFISDCFEFYHKAEDFWTDVSKTHPEAMRLPPSLLQAAAKGEEKAVKQVDRMRRNYVFDRARGFLPLAAKNNMMLVMSARGWMQLAQALLSDARPEAQAVGVEIGVELGIATPQMTRHAVFKQDVAARQAREFRCLTKSAADHWRLARRTEHGETITQQDLKVYIEQVNRLDDPTLFVNALEDRTNRYSPVGRSLRNTAVRFTIHGISFAETRDLNRHRTGSKDSLLAPQGFYCALDQVPEGVDSRMLETLSSRMLAHVEHAKDMLAAGDPGYIYFLPIGFQHYFGHLTTADKFVYETELRTGVGAHFRYAAHMRKWLELWYRKFPQTKGLILEGAAEPE